MGAVKKIIVIGASAGGFEAVTELISALPADIEAAVFVVLHLSKNSAGKIITRHLQKHTALTCVIPADGDPIKNAYLYIAPPDFHMMVKRGLIVINNGPQENRWRPSIDVLFRSAAATYGSHTIGIILTGLMDDGTSGMSAIKRSGGICIVQEPKEALFSDMPASVLSEVEVDYRVPIADMAYIIKDNLAKPEAPMLPIPRDVKLEASITERMISSMDELKELGGHSDFSCPDCGGGLWKMSKDGIHRYRCFTGHVYTEKILNEKQKEGLEESIWVSIRILEERKNLMSIMAQHEKEAGHIKQSADTKKRAGEMEMHIKRLKSVLQAVNE